MITNYLNKLSLCSFRWYSYRIKTKKEIKCSLTPIENRWLNHRLYTTIYLSRLTTKVCEAYYLAYINSMIFERIGDFIAASA